MYCINELLLLLLLFTCKVHESTFTEKKSQVPT